MGCIFIIPMIHLPPESGCITDVRGVIAGHHTRSDRPTGCSVVMVPQGAVAAVDVRGAAPGTRETDLLRSGNLVQRIHAVVLSGGSAWGLDTATGVVAWMEEHGLGMETGFGHLPLVSAAVLFDLPTGNARIRPTAQDGYAACTAASQKPLAQGNVGAGAGATVGKLFGNDCAMKGGIGSASLTLHGITVGALVACNAVGDVRDAANGHLLAGSRKTPDSLELRDSMASLVQGQSPATVLPGTNTTIGVIATDARLSREQLQRLTVAGHDGLARCITPVHTLLDGDTLFALATGQADVVDTPPPDALTLAAMASTVVSMAVHSAICSAQSLRTDDSFWPSAAEAALAARPRPQK